MKDLLLFARTVPEFDMVLRIFGKEFSKFYGNWCWVEELKIFLVIWRESVMTTIYLTLRLATAWLMPHQIAKSSASAVVILITLCKVLTTGLSKEWMCEIEVVTWFLMLVSDITIVEEGLEDTLNMTSSKFFICFLTFIRQEWKENWSGKISII